MIRSAINTNYIQTNRIQIYTFGKNIQFLHKWNYIKLKGIHPIPEWIMVSEKVLFMLYAVDVCISLLRILLFVLHYIVYYKVSRFWQQEALFYNFFTLN